MEIFICDIPAEGLHKSGEFPPSIFELPPDDSILPMGNVIYEVTLYAFEELIAFSGKLQGPFRLQCSTCLEYVDFLADFQDWNSDLDLEEGQRSFNLQEVVREDFLLNLPSHARCDELIDGRSCPKADEVASIQNSSASDPPSPEQPDVWSALDDLS